MPVKVSVGCWEHSFLSAAFDHFRYLNFEQSAGSAQRLAQRGVSDTP
jgi:hypothetical protein